MSAILALLLMGSLPAATPEWTPDELWRLWPQERFVKTSAPCFRHARLMASLEALYLRHPGLRIEEAGRSVEGRAIPLVTVGQGQRKVLLWSQMHGDEPSATPALLDLVDFLLTRAGDIDPDADAVLRELTLLILPMLNPDGAEVYRRRNAQEIDINRDALNLATPEGRILKRLRDEHAPLLGFNLHDQNRRTVVGDTGILATNSVLAVAGDPQGTLSPGRRRAQRACSAVTEALAPLMPGGMGRYDEDWNPRAFGDNLTAWGTPVVLIESGGLPPGRPFTDLARLNFVALLMVLRDLARDDLAAHDPAVYEALPRNRSRGWSDVVVRGGSILQPGSEVPYRADLAFDVFREDRAVAGCVPASGGSVITEVGDTRFLAAGRDVDAAGLLLMAPFVVGVRGFLAHRFLDVEGLKRLARLGVADVYWAVPARRRSSAETHARNVEGPGRARLRVVSATTPLPPLRLTDLPAEPPADSFDDLIGALAGKSWRRAPEQTFSEALRSLMSTPEGALRQRLGPGLRASFLLVSPSSAGLSDLGEARLISVWLDGVEP